MTATVHHKIIISGFGGQGVVLNGNILGRAAALYDKLNATLVQSYGPEARGGACSAHVIISDDAISYPYVNRANILISMSQEGYDNNVDSLEEGALILIDTDLVKERKRGECLLTHLIPATRMAENMGNKMMANITMLGYLASLSNVVKSESLQKAIQDSVPKGTEEMNLKAFQAGKKFGEKQKEQ